MLKYERLTKEQFEELHQEFINFLATQTITAQEWEEIKTNKPEVAEEELDIFSDLIWEGVLEKVFFLELVLPKQIRLFAKEASEIKMIAVDVSASDTDLLTIEGMQWMQQHIDHDQVQVYKASKLLSEDYKLDLFELIQKGAVITEGDLFKQLSELVN